MSDTSFVVIVNDNSLKSVYASHVKINAAPRCAANQLMIRHDLFGALIEGFLRFSFLFDV